MMILMLALYYAKALPEAFKLMKIAAQGPLTDSALSGAEVDPGKWSLQV